MERTNLSEVLPVKKARRETEEAPRVTVKGTTEGFGIWRVLSLSLSLLYCALDQISLVVEFAWGIGFTPAFEPGEN